MSPVSARLVITQLRPPTLVHARHICRAWRDIDHLLPAARRCANMEKLSSFFKGVDGKIKSRLAGGRSPEADVSDD